MTLRGCQISLQIAPIGSPSRGWPVKPDIPQPSQTKPPISSAAVIVSGGSAQPVLTDDVSMQPTIRTAVDVADSLGAWGAEVMHDAASAVLQWTKPKKSQALSDFELDLYGLTEGGSQLNSQANVSGANASGTQAAASQAQTKSWADQASAWAVGSIADWASKTVASTKAKATKAKATKAKVTKTKGKHASSKLKPRGKSNASARAESP